MKTPPTAACSTQVRSVDDLDDYVFVPGTRWMDRSAAIRLDRVDFVFLDGVDAPWDIKLLPVYHLVNHCLTLHKCLIGGPYAFSVVSYVVSTFGKPLECILTGSLDVMQAKPPSGASRPLRTT